MAKNYEIAWGPRLCFRVQGGQAVGLDWCRVSVFLDFQEPLTLRSPCAGGMVRVHPQRRLANSGPTLGVAGFSSSLGRAWVTFARSL